MPHLPPGAGVQIYPQGGHPLVRAEQVLAYALQPRTPKPYNLNCMPHLPPGAGVQICPQGGHPLVRAEEVLGRAGGSTGGAGIVEEDGSI